MIHNGKSERSDLLDTGDNKEYDGSNDNSICWMWDTTKNTICIQKDRKSILDPTMAQSEISMQKKSFQNQMIRTMDQTEANIQLLCIERTLQINKEQSKF